MNAGGLAWVACTARVGDVWLNPIIMLADVVTWLPWVLTTARGPSPDCTLTGLSVLCYAESDIVPCRHYKYSLEELMIQAVETTDRHF